MLSEEVDLLQGRVPKSVFARHYLKENIGEFKDKVLQANSNLENFAILLVYLDNVFS